ncbi:hypothetical protein HDU97_000957 [Phlyctochytrium planicorne]|nr:hypothetical protein HDU97_000957 [Phlyctochytrium planicorne]
MASLPPPSYNDGSGYMWSQTPSTVTVTIPVASDTTTLDVDVVFTEDTAIVKVQSHIRFKGRLFSTIKKKDSLWQFESFPSQPKTSSSSHHRYKLLTLHLEKVVKKNTEWGLPIISGIATEADADSHSLFLIASARHDISDSSSLRRMVAAGDAGSVAAMLKLAAWYELGREEMDVIPVPRNPTISLDWHKRAAEARNPEACYIVMTAFASGSHGCSKSYKEALQWAFAGIEAAGGEELFKKEQESLFVTVAFQAGLMLMEGGNGLGDPNPAAAAELWKLSAEVGHGQSCWNLGIFHLNGFGVPIDIREGVRLIRAGIQKVPSLGLPPQLKELTETQLDTAVALSDAEKKNGRSPDIETLVKAVKSGKTVTAKTSSNPRSKKSTSTTDKKTVESTGESGPGDLVGTSVAVAAIILGVFGLWRALL